MQFALYRYMFEVMEPGEDSPTLPFSEEIVSLTPREAFAQKDALLDQLLLDDYKTLGSAEADALSAESSWPKSLLHFTGNRRKPLRHKYATRPEGSLAILELARLSSVSHRPRAFQPKADREDDYKSLHLIIDGRGTRQHVAIEVKPSVMSTDAVAQSLERALCQAFERYRLRVRVTSVDDSRHFWHLVSDRKRFPQGFKRLRVEFPQINSAEVNEGLNEINLGIHRKHFGTNLNITQEAPQGEEIPFDEEDVYQKKFIDIACRYGTRVDLLPHSARAITIKGKDCVKTGEVPDGIMQQLHESQTMPGLFDADVKSKLMECMDKIYTRQ